MLGKKHSNLHSFGPEGSKMEYGYDLKDSRGRL